MDAQTSYNRVGPLRPFSARTLAFVYRQAEGAGSYGARNRHRVAERVGAPAVAYGSAVNESGGNSSFALNESGGNSSLAGNALFETRFPLPAAWVLDRMMRGPIIPGRVLRCDGG